MYRSLFGRRERGHRPRSRAAGCLLWIVLLIVILIVLSVLFGGFQKGTKANGLGRSCTSPTSCLTTPPGGRPEFMIVNSSGQIAPKTVHDHGLPAARRGATGG
jgi:hypothetical protein